MSILDRIREHGGDAYLHKWELRLRRGRMSDDTIAWVRVNSRTLMVEVWPGVDEFEERAAIREFDGGQTREDAEEGAYGEVVQC